MSDYITMRNRILDDLERDDLTAAVDTEINTAISYYDKESWHFLESHAVLNTVDGQEYYGLPGDFRDQDSLTITVSNWTYPLIKRHYSRLEDWFVKSGTYKGYPTDYAMYAEQIRLYPIPNGTYELKLSYRQGLSELTSASSANAWTMQYEELIRTHAEARLYALKLHDRDAADLTRQVEQDIYRQLKAYSNERQMMGRTRRRR